MIIAAALLVCGCSDVVEQLSHDQGGQAQGNEDLAVGFDAYTHRGGMTRAGVEGEVSTLGLKTDGDLKNAGFGVFGYYSDHSLYNGGLAPLYMYNQQVKYTANNVFEYSPVKYWPNEAADRLSFFAYAPYVEVNRSSGQVSNGQDDTGITGMTPKDAAGDPLIHYVSSMDVNKGVDLCWGVCGTGWKYEDINGATVEPTAGLPLTNLTRMASRTERLELTMRHALAKLNVQVDAHVDGLSAEKELDGGTKIYIRSITFNGFALKGTLNLNNTAANTPLWRAYGNTGRLTDDGVTVYDGRRDGREGRAADSSEYPTGLNASLVQQTVWGGAGETQGVTSAPQNLFGSATETDCSTPLYVIPTGAPVDMTIVYDVETADEKLVGNLLSDGITAGTTIENRIKIYNVFGKMEAGKSYQILLHISMNSVKADVTVADWENNNTGIDID